MLVNQYFFNQHIKSLEKKGFTIFKKSQEKECTKFIVYSRSSIGELKPITVGKIERDSRDYKYSIY
ncbi:hypothetical protein VNTUMSATTG_60120 (plasmid) [Vibrio nigripulchritudo]|nr:hypothetical protein VNTUMSATTG_60120 [Vibrio nigripulchritudo]